jgi:aminoglycoside phosphotransferase family enzyme/adenylate kinase family enzyme
LAEQSITSIGEGAQARLRSSRQLVTALLRPEAFPHTSEELQLLETHCAWVVLSGAFAYKIKKPVNFGFLDYSTLEKRRFFCQEEIRLNRRFSAELYLGVVVITGSPQQPRIEAEGAALEYAVKMRRFPGNGLLSDLADSGQLECKHIDQMIECVARLHDKAERAPADSRYGQASANHHWVTENFRHIRPALSSESDLRQLDAVQQWADQARLRLAPLFRLRKREGRIRECHGDLHLGNLTLIEGQVTPFDCLEFNPGLRWIDVMSDVAFLIMDLQERGYAHFANRFVNGYLQQRGDYHGLGVLPYYLLYRAVVRAKVAVLRAQQAEPASALLRHATLEYHEYMDLAEQYTRERQPCLLITHGLSGSGKSTLARRLAERIGLIQIRSDLERKRLAGLAPLQDSASAPNRGLYRDELTRKTYQRLAELADAALGACYSVVVDATFLRRSQRALFRELAATRGVRFALLDCRAPDAELRRRIELRRLQGRDASEATLRVLDAQIEAREAFDREEQAQAVGVDSAAPGAFDAVLTELRRRGVPDPGWHDRDTQDAPPRGP